MLYLVLLVSSNSSWNTFARENDKDQIKIKSGSENKVVVLLLYLGVSYYRLHERQAFDSSLRLEERCSSGGEHSLRSCTVCLKIS